MLLIFANKRICLRVSGYETEREYLYYLNTFKIHNDKL